METQRETRSCSDRCSCGKSEQESSIRSRLLILACGNTLRGDDGVGPWLAEWIENRFRSEPGLRVILRQQWTPELAEEVARAESALFIDCAADSAPGVIGMVPVAPTDRAFGIATHHLGAAELLALGRELYDSKPVHALLLTIGAGSTELGEDFSEAVKAALPEACRLLEETVLRLLRHGAEPFEATSQATPDLKSWSHQAP